MGLGFTEAQVLVMPMDKLEAYARALVRKNAHALGQNAVSTQAAVASLFDKKALPAYLESLEPRHG